MHLTVASTLFLSPLTNKADLYESLRWYGGDPALNCNNCSGMCTPRPLNAPKCLRVQTKGTCLGKPFSTYEQLRKIEGLWRLADIFQDFFARTDFCIVLAQRKPICCGSIITNLSYRTWVVFFAYAITILNKSRKSGLKIFVLWWQVTRNTSARNKIFDLRFW